MATTSYSDEEIADFKRMKAASARAFAAQMAANPPAPQPGVPATRPPTDATGGA